MANADGGYLAIGIEDDGTITGVDDYEMNLNELLRVPFDFCVPSVMVENKTMDVIDKDGKDNHIVRMHVLQSPGVIHMFNVANRYAGMHKGYSVFLFVS